MTQGRTAPSSVEDLLPPSAGDAAIDDLVLGPTHRRFLEFAVEHPEALERQSFAPIDVLDQFARHQAQPWPAFLEPDRLGRFERAAAPVARLLAELPRRLFANDPERLAHYFDLPPGVSQIVSATIEHTPALEVAIGRGDFLDTVDGLKCLEFNMSSSLGGWPTGVWLERYLDVPVLARFFAESGIRPHSTNPSRVLFEHLLAHLPDQVRRDGELTVAFAVAGPWALAGADWVDYFSTVLSEVLAESPEHRGLAGRVIAVPVGELRLSGDRLEEPSGRPVRVVVEATFGELPQPLLTAALEGHALVLNGAVTRVINDKVALAALSEHAASGLFDADERATIEAHVPWTRRALAEFTDYHDERVYLPDFLEDAQDRLVLKPGRELSGKDVFVGRFTEPDLWLDTFERAVADGSWIVQELVEGVPALFQDGERGTALHDIVWGLFAFGDRFGGSFVRLSPRSSVHQGVVNAHRGASFTLPIEITETR